MVFRRSALSSSAVELSGERSTLSAWLGSRQEAIREVIQDRCAEYGFSSQGSTPAKVVASRPALLQHRSALFEYTITTATPHSPVGLIAKIHRHARVSEDPNLCVMAAIEDGRAEWRQLSNAYPYFSAQANGLGMVRPIAYIEPYHALLVKKASGRELAKIIGAGGSDVMPALARAGHWLARFHGGLHPLSNREWTPAWYAECLEERRCRFLAVQASRGLWEPLLDRVHAHAQRLSLRSVPRSVLHGDFRLRHIWASPEGIEVLDFGNVHEGDCYADVASLVVELMMVRLGRPFVSRRLVDGYIETFLEAYFRADPPAIFEYYVIDRLFKKWGRWLARWNDPAKEAWWAATVQRCLRLAHATGVTNQIYVSRWFVARIREALERADGVKP
jgi:Ser/Thr protein kinase RdoA (MazF antagonist)